MECLLYRIQYSNKQKTTEKQSFSLFLPIRIFCQTFCSCYHLFPLENSWIQSIIKKEGNLWFTVFQITLLKKERHPRLTKVYPCLLYSSLLNTQILRLLTQHLIFYLHWVLCPQWSVKGWKVRLLLRDVSFNMEAHLKLSLKFW